MPKAFSKLQGARIDETSKLATLTFAREDGTDEAFEMAASMLSELAGIAAMALNPETNDGASPSQDPDIIKVVGVHAYPSPESDAVCMLFIDRLGFSHHLQASPHDCSKLRIQLRRLLIPN